MVNIWQDTGRPGAATLAFSAEFWDFVDEPYLLVASDGSVLSANRAFCERFGQSLETIGGRALAELPGLSFEADPVGALPDEAGRRDRPLRRIGASFAPENGRPERLEAVAFAFEGGPVAIILTGGAGKAREVGHDDAEVLMAVECSLSIIRSLMSIEGDENPDCEMRQSMLRSRIEAMIAVLGVLQRHGSEPRRTADLPAAVIGVIAGPGELNRFEGPELALSIKQCLTLALILHDIVRLMHPASGRRADADGGLTVAWRVLSAPGRPEVVRFEIGSRNRETDPARAHSGSSFARQLAAEALDGAVMFVSNSAGAGTKCVLEFPIGRNAPA